MIELKYCPFCGRIDKLDVSCHQTRRGYGTYDSAVYCRRCGAYGPKIRSEDFCMRSIDFRNEHITDKGKDMLKEEAVKLWNRRAE